MLLITTSTTDGLFKDINVDSPGLAAILNAMFLLAAIAHVRRITVSYPRVDCNVRYSSVTIACMGLQSL